MNTYIHDGGRVGDGFEFERLDCAVRAYAIAVEIPYHTAHELFKKAGRKDRHTTGWDVYQNLGIKFNFSHMTLKQFISSYPRGSFYVCMRGHAFAVKDGVVFDKSEIGNRCIIKKWVRVD